MTEDERHLDLLGIFHYVVGGFAALFALFPVFHLAIGIAMVLGKFSGGENPPPPAIGWIFIALAAAFMLVGWTLAAVLVVAGRRIRARRSRDFCFVVACVECIFMPFGTVLGIFTIIVLNKDSVKALFRD